MVHCIEHIYVYISTGKVWGSRSSLALVQCQGRERYEKGGDNTFFFSFCYFFFVRLYHRVLHLSLSFELSENSSESPRHFYMGCPRKCANFMVWINTQKKIKSGEITKANVFFTYVWVYFERGRKRDTFVSIFNWHFVNDFFMECFLFPCFCFFLLLFFNANCELRAYLRFCAHDQWIQCEYTVKLDIIYCEE